MRYDLVLDIIIYSLPLLFLFRLYYSFKKSQEHTFAVNSSINYMGGFLAIIGIIMTTFYNVQNYKDMLFSLILICSIVLFYFIIDVFYFKFFYRITGINRDIVDVILSILRTNKIPCNVTENYNNVKFEIPKSNNSVVLSFVQSKYDEFTITLLRKRRNDLPILTKIITHLNSGMIPDKYLSKKRKHSYMPIILIFILYCASYLFIISFLR